MSKKIYTTKNRAEAVAYARQNGLPSMWLDDKGYWHPNAGLEHTPYFCKEYCLLDPARATKSFTEAQFKEFQAGPHGVRREKRARKPRASRRVVAYGEPTSDATCASAAPRTLKSER